MSYCCFSETYFQKRFRSFLDAVILTRSHLCHISKLFFSNGKSETLKTVLKATCRWYQLRSVSARRSGDRLATNRSSHLGHGLIPCLSPGEIRYLVTATEGSEHRKKTFRKASLHVNIPRSGHHLSYLSSRYQCDNREVCTQLQIGLVRLKISHQIEKGEICGCEPFACRSDIPPCRIHRASPTGHHFCSTNPLPAVVQILPTVRHTH